MRSTIPFARYRRVILIAFGALDALLLVWFAHQIAWPGYVFGGSYSLWFIALEICRPLFLISLAFSAFGLVLARKWAIIFCYVQFPIRFTFVLLSFGFIGRLASIPGFPTSYFALMIVAMALECVRLAVTIAIQRGPDQRLQLNGDARDAL